MATCAWPTAFSLGDLKLWSTYILNVSFIFRFRDCFPARVKSIETCPLFGISGVTITAGDYGHLWSCFHTIFYSIRTTNLLSVPRIWFGPAARNYHFYTFKLLFICFFHLHRDHRWLSAEQQQQQQQTQQPIWELRVCFTFGHLGSTEPRPPNKEVW